MKIIAISNQKGGVGKTTATVNLSTATAIMGKRTLLVDLDSQGNASTSFGINYNTRKVNAYHLMTESIDVDVIAVSTAIPNLDIITATVDLAGLENILYNKQQKELILKKQLAQLSNKYDFIFIDCGPSLGVLTINALAAAHSVIIPLQCEFFAMEGLAHLLNTLRLTQNTINKSLFIEGIILMMFEKRKILCSQVANEVRKEFGNLVYDTIIPRNIKLAEAPSHGKPAIIYDTKCLGSISYIMLAKEFLSKNK